MIKCICCKRDVKDIPEIKWQADSEDEDVEEFVKTDGTYSKTFNTFVCTDCYVQAGCPSVNIRDINDIEKNNIAIINECRKVLNK